MNIYEADILSRLYKRPFSTQRELAEELGFSVGTVNKSLRSLEEQGFLNKDYSLSEKALDEIRRCRPENAVILAAGFGMRMVPINTETPKALLTVHGEPLIERLIKQLHQAGITEIYVVVGFMKEQLEYLIDDFGVKLVVNIEYALKNNLHSMSLVREKLSNTYIVPCDIWCRENPFKAPGLYSWYMVSDKQYMGSPMRVNRKDELVLTHDELPGNKIIGISYLLKPQSEALSKRIALLSRDIRYDTAFWEDALFEKGRFPLAARCVGDNDAVEINTYEQLRELDGDSNSLKSDALEAIAAALSTRISDIHSISVLKKGMTNRSFLFSCEGEKYIMRIPGEGTDMLIDRRHEAQVFSAIAPYGFCDKPVYLNPENGYKITKFLSGVRNCDPLSEHDLIRCMDKLRSLHNAGLKVEHSFDIFGQIEFYESLRNGSPSAYRDYKRTKDAVFSLRDYIESHVEKLCLTHIDAVPDNFLFYTDEKGNEALQLTDWEYAGMQDPHVDIAMFCIYALYKREQIERLIDIYFEGNCPEEIRIKIHCYIAVCGLLWSNWCEYKSSLGVEFGEYSIMQYRYAKEYCRLAKEEMKNV